MKNQYLYSMLSITDFNNCKFVILFLKNNSSNTNSYNAHLRKKENNSSMYLDEWLILTEDQVLLSIITHKY